MISNAQKNNIIIKTNLLQRARTTHHGYFELIGDEEEQDYVCLTLEKMSFLERNKRDIKPEDYFYNKLNDIFEKLLGTTIRREFNYFKAQDFVEERLLLNLNNINQEELWEYGIKIVRKDPEKRLFEEMIILQKITENCSAFKKIRSLKGRRVLFECMRNLRYKYEKEGACLQKQNEIVKYMWIVLKGVLEVKQLASKRDTKPVSETLKQYTLQSGMSFGDKEVLSVNSECKSDVCVFFETNCHLAQFEIARYSLILEENAMVELQQQINVFGKIDVLQNCLQLKSIQMLFMRTQLITLNRNNILATQGKPLQYIYLLKSGEVKLTRILKYKELPARSAAKTMPFQENKDKIQTNTDAEGDPLLPHSHPHLHENELQKIRSVAKPFEVAILSKGNTIGLKEYFRDGKYLGTSSVYSTSAELYRFTKKDFGTILAMDSKAKKKMAQLFQLDNNLEEENQNERLTNYNHYFGKIDEETKEKISKLENIHLQQQSEEQIKNCIADGQRLIMQSNVNLNCNYQEGMGNVDYILSQVKRKRMVRKDQAKQIFSEKFLFTENDLQNINHLSFKIIKVPKKVRGEQEGIDTLGLLEGEMRKEGQENINDNENVDGDGDDDPAEAEGTETEDERNKRIFNDHDGQGLKIEMETQTGHYDDIYSTIKAGKIRSQEKQYRYKKIADITKVAAPPINAQAIPESKAPYAPLRSSVLSINDNYPSSSTSVEPSTQAQTLMRINSFDPQHPKLAHVKSYKKMFSKDSDQYSQQPQPQQQPSSFWSESQNNQQKLVDQVNSSLQKQTSQHQLEQVLQLQTKQENQHTPDNSLSSYFIHSNNNHKMNQQNQTLSSSFIKSSSNLRSSPHIFSQTARFPSSNSNSNYFNCKTDYKNKTGSSTKMPQKQQQKGILCSQSSYLSGRSSEDISYLKDLHQSKLSNSQNSSFDLSRTRCRSTRFDLLTSPHKITGQAELIDSNTSMSRSPVPSDLIVKRIGFFSPFDRASTAGGFSTVTKSVKRPKEDCYYSRKSSSPVANANSKGKGSSNDKETSCFKPSSSSLNTTMENFPSRPGRTISSSLENQIQQQQYLLPLKYQADSIKAAIKHHSFQSKVIREHKSRDNSNNSSTKASSRNIHINLEITNNLS